MGLQEYYSKRDFKITSEPKGKKLRSKEKLIFVVQEHHASHLHYDFRLEAEGTLKSWAVPKGPSNNPKDKRLAVEVEDHPISYAKFHGKIPKGQYGGGEVFIWDQGYWVPKEPFAKAYEKGRIEFQLKGKKLKGTWVLIRSSRERNWLLIKKNDEKNKVSTRKEKIKKSMPTDLEKVKGVIITHPDRMLYPEAQVSKLDLVKYYEAVFPMMKPFFKDRPVSVMRCHGDTASSCFFQKHSTPGIVEKDVAYEDKKGKALYVKTEKDFIEALQGGVVEWHAWQSRFGKIEKPDMLVFDLDPESKKLWSRVVDTAYEIREKLLEMNLQSFVKVTGGKGLHVQLPIKPQLEWNQIKDFCRNLMEEFVERNPKHFTTNMSKDKRSNRIFLDYLRNAYAATAVMPYSLRSHEEPTLAVPVSWEELKNLSSADEFQLPDFLKMMNRRKDPWKEFWNLSQSLPGKKQK